MIMLLELSIEYYDPLMLKKIRQAIGLVLSINAHIANGTQGWFARLCVQVNVEKPYHSYWKANPTCPIQGD